MSSNFIKILQYRLPAEQIKSVLQRRAMLFHLLVFIWHILLNYKIFSVTFYILFNRQDLVANTYGLGLQYISVWNLVLEETYFNASLLQDILEFTSPSKYPKLKRRLKIALPHVFSSILFPLSIMISINFWVVYSYNPRNIDNQNVIGPLYPVWINHGFHTVTSALTLIEKYMVYRKSSPGRWRVIGLMSTFALYVLVCFILYLFGGLWPYPVLLTMSLWQWIFGIKANVILAYVILTFEEFLNDKIWEKKSDIVQDTAKKAL